jgi:hypothetical protein
MEMPAMLIMHMRRRRCGLRRGVIMGASRRMTVRVIVMRMTVM